MEKIEFTKIMVGVLEEKIKKLDAEIMATNRLRFFHDANGSHFAGLRYSHQKTDMEERKKELEKELYLHKEDLESEIINNKIKSRKGIINDLENEVRELCERKRHFRHKASVACTYTFMQEELNYFNRSILDYEIKIITNEIAEKEKEIQKHKDWIEENSQTLIPRLCDFQLCEKATEIKRRFEESLIQEMNESTFQISDDNVEDLINTVHFNACVNTINACIKHWGINTSKVTIPPHPSIDKIKK